MLTPRPPKSLNRGLKYRACIWLIPKIDTGKVYGFKKKIYFITFGKAA
jgi:hypothetical protein